MWSTPTVASSTFQLSGSVLLLGVFGHGRESQGVAALWMGAIEEIATETTSPLTINDFATQRFVSMVYWTSAYHLQFLGGLYASRHTCLVRMLSEISSPQH